VATAPVKRASSRTAAECLPPAAAQRRIQDAARDGVARLLAGRAPRPLVVAPPIELRIEFTHSNFADGAALMPGAERDGRAVRYSARDMLEAYRAFRALMALA